MNPRIWGNRCTLNNVLKPINASLNQLPQNFHDVITELLVAPDWLKHATVDWLAGAWGTRQATVLKYTGGIVTGREDTILTKPLSHHKTELSNW